MQAFDDLGGEFQGRLREIVSTTRQTTDGSSTVTFSTARIECDYTPNVVKKLGLGQLIAIPNVQALGGKEVYSLYEIADVYPMHYSMLTLDRSQPAAIRKEFMDLIQKEWEKGSKSTWIEIVAAPISYVMRVKDGSVSFERRPYAALTGSAVKLLSRESVQQLICFKPEANAEDYRFGSLLSAIDESIPFLVDIESLINYHVGVFAFSLDYSEPIIYRENGQVKITEIGSLVDRFFAGSKEDEGRKYTKSLEVVSFDPSTYDVRWTPIRYVFRHRFTDKLLRFTLRTGRSVSVTPGHSLFILRKGSLLCLPASQIAEGDQVVGTRAIPEVCKSNLRVNLAELFSGRDAKDTFMIEVPTSVFGRLTQGRVPYWKWWRWRHYRKLPLTYWGSLTPEERRRIKLGYKGAKAIFSPLLEIDEDVARLLGYYAAEGHVTIERALQYSVQFTLSKEDRRMASELERILRSKFGIRPRKFRHGENGVRIAFNNKVIAHFLRQSAGTGARRKSVPQLILNSPPSVRQEFIRAWAEGDYPSSSSRKLTNGLLYTLLFDHCAGSVQWIEPSTSTIEGHTVHGNGRYQFSFPRGREMKGVIRPTRKRAEPIYPVSELPRSLYSLLLHPSQAKESNARLTGVILSDLDRRLTRLMSYDGSPVKSTEEARADGVYRRGMTAYLVRDQNTIRASQGLVQAWNDMKDVKLLQESLLGFYEVQKIESVKPTSEFVYDVSVPYAENFLAGFGGIFCHNTGSGKSNLTAAVIRKALKVVPDLKVVIFDVSSEYGVHILDVLNDYPSRVLFTDSFAESEDPAGEYFRRHATPEGLVKLEKQFERKVSKLFADGKVKFVEIPLAAEEGIAKFSTYGGLVEVLSNTLNDKYGAVQQKIFVPQVIKMIEQFRVENKLEAESSFDSKTRKLVDRVQPLLADLPANSSLKKTFENLAKVVEMISEEGEEEAEADRYSWDTLVDEVLSPEKESPRVFVVNLPEAEDARLQTADVISKVFRKRKRSFTLTPRVLFIIDEAQEFMPQETRKEDGTYQASMAVERLLRHGRKYHLHCWVSTQRIARLNTNALQQLHSYFVSTMPRPYDRQLISDTFAIDDAFIDRTLAFQNGDWLLTSFKATATQNIPVFFHAENNEDVLKKYVS